MGSANNMPSLNESASNAAPIDGKKEAIKLQKYSSWRKINVGQLSEQKNTILSQHVRTWRAKDREQKMEYKGGPLE
jgi:hypothetical protein